MTDQTRANFEAHFQLTQRQAWQHKDGSYQFPEIQAKWEGYLAGVAKAAPVAVPDGWKLVPMEPTEAMRDAAEKTVPQVFSMGDEYRAMVEAAPVAAAAPGADRMPHGWLYGNSFWHRDNPRITEDVMKNGKPLYE